ncbi:MAG: adenosylhomocysteinase [Acidimicrobiia bacterium]
MNVAARSRIADLALAPCGHQAIDWVQRRSPVLDGYVRTVLADGVLRGRRVAVVVRLEAKTAFLATVLADAGATVVVVGSNPGTTRDDVCSALVERGIEVHSSRGSSAEVWEADLLAVADTEPELIIDDGAELTLRISRHRPLIYQRLVGVSEETTTGVARLRQLDEAGRLPMPAIAANDAACKHMFDNRYGTGQSTIQAILKLTNLRLPGKRVVVVGYGWVGRGIANYVRALGARAIVVEVDPIKALEALSDGHDVSPLADALPQADFVITATGGVRTIGGEHAALLAPSVILANAGHHDLEIDVPALRRLSRLENEVREGVTQIFFRDKSVYVLSQGALVNIAGGMGHPVEIMDLYFSVQALCCYLLAQGGLSVGVHRFPEDLDRAIALAKLASRGVAIDPVDPGRLNTLIGSLEGIDG